MNRHTVGITRLFFLAALLGVLAIAASAGAAGEMNAQTPPETRTLSPYFFVKSDDPSVDQLPLKSTRARVVIAGVIADVRITQVYKNEGGSPLEALYVFPASTRAAVHAMRMTIGERVIEADIMERNLARQTYEQAKQAGQTASLLEQQRPNVFQMNVANILPGDVIEVELSYTELLIPENQTYEFVYPAVVGPRYSETPAAGAPDNQQWVENPYLHEGAGTPYEFGLTVELRAGMPIERLTSPSHEISTGYSGPDQADISLKKDPQAGNRDFVLRYQLAGKQIQSGLILYPGEEENYFLLMMEPPARVVQDNIVPREYIFIVDVSGSMNGFPLDTTKALMSEIITNLNRNDMMNVILFAGGASALSPDRSLPATEENKKRAINWINSQHGGGGTRILPALQQALSLPETEGCSRIVTVATDGYVNVEPEVFELIRRNLGRANLFAFGIGSSVNRFLIEGMARVGQGEPFVVLDPAEAPARAAGFRQYIQSPVLTGISVAFDGVEAYDVEPIAVPDLFALRPVTVFGKFKGAPKGKVTVSGRTANGDFRKSISLSENAASPENSAIRLLWARHRIARLSDLNNLVQDDRRVEEVTSLGLEYHLMTAYTSFVAVDKIRRADGSLVTVKQPLPLPQGVSDLAVGESAAYKSAQYGGIAPAPGSMRLLSEARTNYDAEKAAPEPLPVQGAFSTAVEEIRGGLNRAETERVLAGIRGKIETCALRRMKSSRAEAVFRVLVNADGSVKDVLSVNSSGFDDSLLSCLEIVFRNVRFKVQAGREGEVFLKIKVAGPGPGK